MVEDPTRSPHWKALQDEAARTKTTTLREIFHSEQDRVARCSVEGAGLIGDFSKHRLSRRGLELLGDLATEQGLSEKIEAMFRGDRINISEDRSVLHVALRMTRGTHLVVDGVDVVAEVHRVLDHMASLARQVRDGLWRGATGRAIRTVINIGIGGSDLGPAMVAGALRDFSSAHLDLRFVANVDPAALLGALDGCDPATTMFIVSSKTFTTLETLTNAHAARQWLVSRLGAGDDVVRHHFLAVSTNSEAVRAFGIDPANMVGFWDFVGGRYSVDAAIGLSVMIAIGPSRFSEFLDGFRSIDEHFRSASWLQNLPVLMGLHAVWYRNFLGAQTQAVLPYAERLARFPAYLQQLTMESNGKSVRLDGASVEADTGAIVWGEPGTNAQHAFFQLLHQGTSLIPADFILFAEPYQDLDSQHDLLIAAGLAQSAALAFGRSDDELHAAGVPEKLIPHRRMPGNRPSTTLMVPKLTPRSLGQLIALYEHSVFTQGVIWGIDSFDQWGVELGKVMANDLVQPLRSGALSVVGVQDASTAALIERYRGLRGRNEG
ncbi:MAG: glucose-6-phosphate isomerase [Ferrimicrobium sp.]